MLPGRAPCGAVHLQAARGLRAQLWPKSFLFFPSKSRRGFYFLAGTWRQAASPPTSTIKMLCKGEGTAAEGPFPFFGQGWEKTARRMLMPLKIQGRPSPAPYRAGIST